VFGFIFQKFVRATCRRWSSLAEGSVRSASRASSLIGPEAFAFAKELRRDRSAGRQRAGAPDAGLPSAHRGQQRGAWGPSFAKTLRRAGCGPSKIRIPAALLCLTIIAGCRQAQVEVYRIPKEQIALEDASLQQQKPQALPQWAAPDSWKQESTSEMRIASFAIPNAGGKPGDVSVTAFPGDAGGLEANVNRWRGQLKLPTLSADELAKTWEQTTVDGIPAVLVDLTDNQTDPNGQRVLGAVLRTADRTWFVKATGPNNLLAAEKARFQDFVRSFRFSDSGDQNAPTGGKIRSTNDK
jgi:hypothetical protein